MSVSSNLLEKKILVVNLSLSFLKLMWIIMKISQSDFDFSNSSMELRKSMIEKVHAGSNVDLAKYIIMSKLVTDPIKRSNIESTLHIYKESTSNDYLNIYDYADTAVPINKLNVDVNLQILFDTTQYILDNITHVKDISDIYTYDHIIRYINTPILTYIKLRQQEIGGSTVYPENKINNLYLDIEPVTKLSNKVTYNSKAFSLTYKVNDNTTDSYAFGPFTKVYPDEKGKTQTEVVKDIANDMRNITDAINEKKDVIMVGYGSSGVGKTTFLVYKTADKKKGVVGEQGLAIMLLKNLQRKKLILTLTEFSAENSTLYGLKNTDIDDVFWESLRDTISKSHVTIDDNGTFNPSSNSILIKPASNMMQVSIVDLMDDQNVVNEQSYNAVGLLIAKFFGGESRQTAGTPNNIQSSRSHMIANINFGEEIGSLTICDMAGFESEFQCDEKYTNFLMKTNNSLIKTCIINNIEDSKLLSDTYKVLTRSSDVTKIITELDKNIIKLIKTCDYTYDVKGKEVPHPLISIRDAISVEVKKTTETEIDKEALKNFMVKNMFGFDTNRDLDECTDTTIKNFTNVLKKYALFTKAEEVGSGFTRDTISIIDEIKSNIQSTIKKQLKNNLGDSFGTYNVHMRALNNYSFDLDGLLYELQSKFVNFSLDLSITNIIITEYTLVRGKKTSDVLIGSYVYYTQTPDENSDNDSFSLKKTISSIKRNTLERVESALSFLRRILTIGTSFTVEYEKVPGQSPRKQDYSTLYSVVAKKLQNYGSTKEYYKISNDMTNIFQINPTAVKDILDFLFNTKVKSKLDENAQYIFDIVSSKALKENTSIDETSKFLSLPATVKFYIPIHYMLEMLDKFYQKQIFTEMCEQRNVEGIYIRESLIKIKDYIKWSVNKHNPGNPLEISKCINKTGIFKIKPNGSSIDPPKELKPYIKRDSPPVFCIVGVINISPKYHQIKENDYVNLNNINILRIKNGDHATLRYIYKNYPITYEDLHKKTTPRNYTDELNAMVTKLVPRNAATQMGILEFLDSMNKNALSTKLCGITESDHYKYSPMCADGLCNKNK